jgi:hypothetical protein
MLSAFYEVVTGREPEMLRAYLLAVLIQMIGVNAMAEFGLLHASIPLFIGAATVIGGFIFGIGMVLSMGCAGAVLYRAGEGKIDYILVMVAYALGAWAANNWLVTPLLKILYGEGRSLTLHHTLTIDRWLVIAIIAVGVLLWIIHKDRRPYYGGWKWSVTGMLVGFIGIFTWLASSLTGKPSGLGTMQGSDSLASFFLEWDISALDWSFFMVAGIPLGSFIASRLYGKSPGKPFHSKRIPLALTGGLLMGMSAAIAAGDNVLHGLSGVPLLALGSITFMGFVFLGVLTGVRLNLLR